MTDPRYDTSLWEESHSFAERLNYVMGSVLPGVLPLFRAEESRNGLVVVSADPFPLYRQGRSGTFAFLDVSFRCVWSSQQPMLAVNKSVFKLRGPAGGPPVLHVDYQRHTNSDLVPVAHYNVSSQHPLLRDLADPDGEAEGENQRAEVTRRIHLPVGGHRFRPALEDVITMLIADLKIEPQRGWEDYVREGRGLFREMQTAAAVRDHPAKAVEELSRMGYDVKWPGEPEDKPGLGIRERFYRF